MQIKFRDELVRIFMKTEGLSEGEFCQKCNITKKQFKDVMASRNCNLLVIIKIANVLHMQIIQLFELK